MRDIKISANHSREALYRRFQAAKRFAASILPQMTSTEMRSQYKTKPDGTLVTALDSEINERFFRTVIAGEFKDDPVISEETKNIFDPSKDGYWVIDPLDGTHNYSNARAPYAASIGFVLNGEPIFGVVVRSDLAGFSIVSAFKGAGVELDDKPYTPPSPPFPTVGLDFNNAASDGLTGVIPDLHQKFREIRSMGSVVSSMLEVAMGSLNCYVCIPPKTWDVAATLAILREAGMVSNLPRLDLAQLAKNRHKLNFVVVARDQETLEETSMLVQQSLFRLAMSRPAEHSKYFKDISGEDLLPL